MKALLLLIALIANCHASSLEDNSFAPRLDRADRQSHALGGAVIGAVARCALERHATTWSWWQKDIAAIAVAAAVGVAKEVVDAHRRNDSAEVGDAVATAIGGAGGVVLIDLTFRF